MTPPQLDGAASPRALPAAASLASLPYRRSNPSLSRLFEATTASPASRSTTGTATPAPATVSGPAVRSPGARLSGAGTPSSLPPGVSDEHRALLHRAFVPHVAVVADAYAEELVRAKGLDGGLLQLLRPFGEAVPGKVTIRDSIGASKSYDDFGIRFVAVEDAYPALRGQRPRRTGGDVAQIEELVDRHLQYSEFSHQHPASAYTPRDEPAATADSTSSPFHTLYLRRLLSGMPIVPHETFSHPVAGIIAISSRNPHPIEELRRLYNRQHDGDLRFPQWVENDFLRYYVLIHDEDTGDIAKSNQTFDSMKRHFGLHCHLLRLKSQQCIPSDDDSVPLPTCEWMSASEELAEIQRRGTSTVYTKSLSLHADHSTQKPQTTSPTRRPISQTRTSAAYAPLSANSSHNPSSPTWSAASPPGTSKSSLDAVASQAASCPSPNAGRRLAPHAAALRPRPPRPTPTTTACKASTAPTLPRPLCADWQTTAL